MTYENDIEKLTTVFPEVPFTGSSRRMAHPELSKGTSKDIFTSSIGIPRDYKWCGNRSGDALHDYCTKSPDMPPIGNYNYVAYNALDHRDACAIHDLCHAASNRN